MICYVLLYQKDELIEKNGMEVKLRFEQISGEPCLVLHYLDLNPKVARDLRPTAILYSGFGRPFATYDVKTFLPVAEVIKEVDLPQMGFCAGHQLIGFAYNRDLRRVKRLYDEPMRKLRAGEPDWFPEYHAGYYKEHGFHPVSVLREDPLFAGLGRTPMLPQAHFAEVKRVPPGFMLLASGRECRVQAMRHRTRPLYGTQFHPEKYAPEYPAGRRLLRNFFTLAQQYLRNT